MYKHYKTSTNSNAYFYLLQIMISSDKWCLLWCMWSWFAPNIYAMKWVLGETRDIAISHYKNSNVEDVIYIWEKGASLNLKMLCFYTTFAATIIALIKKHIKWWRGWFLIWVKPFYYTWKKPSRLLLVSSWSAMTTLFRI